MISIIYLLIYKSFITRPIYSFLCLIGRTLALHFLQIKITATTAATRITTPATEPAIIPMMSSEVFLAESKEGARETRQNFK